MLEFDEITKDIKYPSYLISVYKKEINKFEKNVLFFDDPVTRTYLLDDKVPKVIQLNESGSAYILVDYLPEELSYNAHNQFDSM